MGRCDATAGTPSESALGSGAEPGPPVGLAGRGPVTVAAEWHCHGDSRRQSLSGGSVAREILRVGIDPKLKPGPVSSSDGPYHGQPQC